MFNANPIIIPFVYESWNTGRVEYEGIVLCSCGHGKSHHKGKFGNCTCNIGHYKNEKLCECQGLDVVKIIYNDQTTLEVNGKVE